MAIADECWAIVHDHFGVYYGSLASTRVAAIAEHVATYNLACKPFVVGGRLDAQQRAEWQRRKRHGDRAARVRVAVIDK